MIKILVPEYVSVPNNLYIHPSIYAEGILTLKSDIDGYSKIVEGSPSQIVTTSTANGFFINKSKVRKGFSIKVNYREIAVGYLIKLIAIESLINSIPFTVHDYIGIEGLEDYTVRNGFILDPVEESPIYYVTEDTIVTRGTGDEEGINLVGSVPPFIGTKPDLISRGYEFEEQEHSYYSDGFSFTFKESTLRDL